MTADKKFIPVKIGEGDEYYVNGIFEFNITRMIEDIDTYISGRYA